MSVATHILLAVDFSEASEEAVASARELARVTGARLTVLHVHGRPPGAPEAAVPEEKIVSSADLDVEAREALERLRSSELAGVESVRLATVERASTPLAICDFAEQNGVDVIVIGTHGRSGMARLMIGSVAEKVVRHARCAVLAVPHAKFRPPT